MIRPIDHDARERVELGLDESLLVEAGAGTGKTTALVARVANVLRSGHATVDDVAVVTFTKDAAAELVSRVRERLEDDLAADPPSPEDERLRLDEALRGLYRARIATLHVFASQLLRERPVEARVDPGLRILSGLEREQLFAQHYSPWLDEVLMANDPDLRLALNRGLQLKHLEEACRHVDAHRAALPLAPISVPPPDHAGARAAITRCGAEVRAIVPRCLDSEDKGILQWPAMRDFLDAVERARDDLELERVALERWPTYVKPNAGRQGSWPSKEDCRAFKEAVGALKEAVEEYRRRLRGGALARILPLAERFVRRFACERRRAGVADFDDLLLWARDLLRDDAAARRWLRDRYRCVLVDEFQDTDPLQAEIALLLTSHDGGRAWDAMTPAPGALVVVGDPKQSIYRFRGADIATYDRMKQGPLANGRAILRQNFRSVGGLLSWVNRLFEREFGAGEARRQAPHVALEPWRAERVDAARAPVVVVPDPGSAGEELKADEARRREAELIARTLRHVVSADGWRVGDGAGRRATHGDVAVLIPAWGALRHLVEAFEAHGIPYRSDGGIGLFQQPEIVELVSILRAVDDPVDAVSVVGALRSDAFGCSADDLVRYAAVADGRFDPRWIADDGPEPVVEGLRTIAAWRRQRRGLSLPELVQRVVDGSGLVELALEQSGGAQAAGNVLRVVEEARAFGATGGGLKPFTRWLAERESDEEAVEASVADAADPVVRIMTVHGAKGLEFPIVVLAAFDSRGNTTAGAAQARPDDHRLELKLGSDFETPGYGALADDEKELLALERKRLLYVAVTRARDHLVIPLVRVAEKRDGHLKTLTPLLPAAGADQFGTDVDGVHVLDPALLPVDVPEPPPAPSADGLARVEELVAEEEAWVLARSEARELASTGLVQTVASSVQPIDRIRPLAAAATATAADAANGDEATAEIASAPPLRMGSALHLVMDRIALDGSEDVAALVRAACLESGLPGAERELESLVRACLASAVTARAVASGRVRREVPFTVAVPPAGYAVGRVDLVFVEEAELVVVDWKSDTLPDATDAALAAGVAVHSGQALAYAAALEQATGLRVREVVFVFARAGAERAIEIDDERRGQFAAVLASGESYGEELVNA